jgi:hypothetical protein
MRTIMLATVGVLLSLSTVQAVTCANGVYRAGCAGPNGVAVVRKPYAYHPVVRPRYHPPYHPTCASGPYRAGCAGPNGAAVVRRPY